MFIYGYNFPLNDTSFTNIANDKSCTSEVLTSLNIPNVEHRYFMSPNDLHYVKYLGVDSNWSEMSRLLEKYGKIDILLNVAGVAPKVRADLLEMTEESYDYVMGINTKGTLFLTQRVANEMIKGGIQGSIVNISSMSAYTSSVNRGEYCISKAGASMITTLFADRLAEYGIMVNEVRPGIIATDMTSKVQ